MATYKSELHAACWRRDEPAIRRLLADPDIDVNTPVGRVSYVYDIHQ